MELVSNFVRSNETEIPHYFVPVQSRRGRPPIRLRVMIRNEEDAERANRDGVPLFALESRTVTAMGCPMRFPTQLVVAKSIQPAVESPLRQIEFISEQATLNPRVEDIAVALLDIDPVIARVLLERNRDAIRPDYLLKRVLTENKERVASWVRFFDLAESLPRVGKSISEVNLAREFGKNLPAGTIP
jgi:hypothetical protein